MATKADNSANKTDSFVADHLQRPLRDLRISVTDRCNLRCTYCMPRDVFGKDYVFLPRAELLSFEEIVRVAGIFLNLGVNKIRLTGGEPMLRHGIEHLIGALANLLTRDGRSPEIAMTTNGVLLPRKAQALKDAGLSRVTVSLDALSEPTFRLMSDSNESVATVLDGIAKAQAVGFAPLKVNVVVKRGANEHEILPLIRYFRHSGVILRFIEFMDVGSSNGWRMDDVMTAREILDLINAHYPLQALDPNYGSEVAKRWAFADGGGEIGIIASVTQAFCQDCSRIRLSTDGKLYTCLFASSGVDLREALRGKASDDDLSRRIVDTWTARSDRYSQIRHAATKPLRKKIEMSYIGG